MEPQHDPQHALKMELLYRADPQAFAPIALTILWTKASEADIRTAIKGAQAIRTDSPADYPATLNALGEYLAATGHARYGGKWEYDWSTPLVASTDTPVATALDAPPATPTPARRKKADAAKDGKTP